MDDDSKPTTFSSRREEGSRGGSAASSRSTRRASAAARPSDSASCSPCRVCGWQGGERHEQRCACAHLRRAERPQHRLARTRVGATREAGAVAAKDEHAASDWLRSARHGDSARELVDQRVGELLRLRVVRKRRTRLVHGHARARDDAHATRFGEREQSTEVPAGASARGHGTSARRRGGNVRSCVVVGERVIPFGPSRIADEGG